MSANAWCVVNRNGHLVTSTIAPRRQGAMQRMVGDEPGWQGRWRKWRTQYGCRCVRVIVEVAP